PPRSERSGLLIATIALTLLRDSFGLVPPIGGQGASHRDLLSGEMALGIAAGIAPVALVRFEEFALSCGHVASSINICRTTIRGELGSMPAAPNRRYER